MPVAYAMLISGMIGITILNSIDVAFNIATTEIYTQFSNYTLSAIPMFVWMGYLAYYTGIGTKLFDICK